MKAQGLNVLIELLPDREQDLVRRLCHNDHIASRAQHIRQIQHQRKHSQARQPRNIRICHIYINGPLDHQRPRQRRRQCDQNQDRDECNCPFIVQKIPEHPDQRAFRTAADFRESCLAEFTDMLPPPFPLLYRPAAHTARTTFHNSVPSLRAALHAARALPPYGRPESGSHPHFLLLKSGVQ